MIPLPAIGTVCTYLVDKRLCTVTAVAEDGSSIMVRWADNDEPMVVKVGQLRLFMWPGMSDPADSKDVAFDGFRLTDTGNAERLLHIAEGRLHFVKLWQKWIAYEGGVWQIDRGEIIATEIAKEVAKSLIRGYTTNEERKFALKCENVGMLASTLKAARGLPGIALDHESLETKPHLLNCPNGSVDLRAGELKPHDPADLLIIQSPVEYEPSAEAPLWEKCLERWQPEEEVREYLQVWAGACATGKPTETFDIHWGDGGNGKTVFSNTLAHVLGTTPSWHP